ncbi:DegT/DnrJ/EryC1/StrS family aminotransferase [Paracoccus aestuariivivens]|uniref:DegT/DnrJ/EryC1/StrS family aminotransferase n=1 Tax=Paracoccus aestuariivivens TaxID=1820333 RepID=A0A6L6J6R2_9RHOB|nr:DegT/DnrJ/EryC1/StrS family aminotransferase [Paracoccus aestuariivivens]MTH76898.1 DegT/DnrJ/EryC1/StrS family aminotransferase [Paracoccus aestuariivivens]
MTNAPIFVTRPVLPPLSEMMPFLERIWSSRILSNNGPLLQQFEANLASYLGVQHLSVVCNASLGLVLSLRHFGITGEVITSPFSFVATAHAIRWAGAQPVFADVDPNTLNLDPETVEAQITPQTQAIMAVHCYGIPCDTEGLAAVARRNGLKLIYDAAHAFGVRKGGAPLVAEGDMSVISFHATKVFHSFEGGAIISPDRQTKVAIDRLMNYGIVDEVTVSEVGLNTKMSELHAAVGLAMLPRIDEIIDARDRVANRYWQSLSQIPGLHCLCPPGQPGHNSYAFPVRIGQDYPISRDELYTQLRLEGIFARRYFHPLISDLPMYSGLPSTAEGRLPRARAAGDEILCLPLYPDLAEADQDRIIGIVSRPC